MKEHLAQLVSGQAPLRGCNLAREYLQARSLGALLVPQRPRVATADLALLNAALRQTGWAGTEMTPSNWRHAVAERVDRLDWNRAASDVRPLLERDEDAELVDRNTALRLLR